jgi:hypothetical protein
VIKVKQDLPGTEAGMGEKVEEGGRGEKGHKQCMHM